MRGRVGLENGSIYKGLWSMQEGTLELSRKLQGMQTIIVHEVLLGLESAGDLWYMGEENGKCLVWGCGFGVVGLGSVEAPICPMLPPSLPLHLPTLTPAQFQAQNKYSLVARNI